MSKKNLRRISQGLFLILFLFLFIQTESRGNDTLGYPVKLFLDFDTLIFITTLFASHGSKIPAAFFLSLSVIFITIFLGRVFCGWICPLGTLNNIVSSINKRHTQRVPWQWHRAKYYILIALLTSSIFTLQIAGIIDPISLLIRSFSISVYPLLNWYPFPIRCRLSCEYPRHCRCFRSHLWFLEKIFSFIHSTLLSPGSSYRLIVLFYSGGAQSR